MQKNKEKSINNISGGFLMKIKLPKNIKFLLFGAGTLAKYTLRQLPKYFIDSVLISNSEWDKVWSFIDESTIFTYSKQLKIKSLDAEKYENVISFIKKEKLNLCLVIGSKWIFANDFLDYFDGLVFNYHPADIPKYRGGGAFSWQIMNNENRTYVTIHQMVKKVDSGPIIIKKERLVKDKPVPKDFHQVTFELAKEVILEFLKNIKNNQNNFILSYEQKNEKSTYFPLLKAEVNGSIEFRWDIKYIERFIRAFSYPYKGAYTFYRNKKVYILEAEIGEKCDFHPFCYGLITRIYGKNVGIICRGGILKVNKIKIDENIYQPSKLFKIGGRLWTSSEIIDKSIVYRQSNKDYTLKSKNIN